MIFQQKLALVTFYSPPSSSVGLRRCHQAHRCSFSGSIINIRQFAPRSYCYQLQAPMPNVTRLQWMRTDPDQFQIRLNFLLPSCFRAPTMPTTLCKSASYTSLPDEEPESGLLLHRGGKTTNPKASRFFIAKHWREVILLALVFVQSIGLYVLGTRQQHMVVSTHCETTRAHSYGQFLYCEFFSFCLLV
jgi:hypothetical protein